MGERDIKIIFIHGACMSAAAFSRLAPLLPYACLAIDLPGHGQRRGMPACETITAMAAFVRAQILNGEKPAGVILAGHSMGGLVALSAMNDAAVMGVISLSAGAEMPVNPDLLGLARTDPAEAAASVCKWSVPKGNPDAEKIRAEVANAMSGNEAALHSDLAACDGFDLSSLLPLKKPVAVIAGEVDKMVSTQSFMRLAAAGGKNPVLIPGCGHMPMIERPQECAAALRLVVEQFFAR